MKKFDLPCFDRRRSFYGKARVTEYDDGRRVLTSYNKDVAEITATGEFLRLWWGYSATTMRHVNSFLRFYGLDGGGKSWWDACPVQESGENGRLTNAESYAAMMGRRAAG